MQYGASLSRELPGDINVTVGYTGIIIEDPVRNRSGPPHDRDRFLRGR